MAYKVRVKTVRTELVIRLAKELRQTRMKGNRDGEQGQRVVTRRDGRIERVSTWVEEVSIKTKVRREGKYAFI